MSTLILSRNTERAAPLTAAETVFLFPGQSSVGPDIVVLSVRRE
jgi:hypothetical protein